MRRPNELQVGYLVLNFGDASEMAPELFRVGLIWLEDLSRHSYYCFWPRFAEE